MVDVDETYASIYKNEDNGRRKKGGEAPRSQSSGAGDKTACDREVELLVKRVEALRVSTSSNIQHRHLNQLFIRGDNVVSISSCS